MLRASYLLSTAALAIAVSFGGANAQDQATSDGVAHPFRGDIDPFRGDINPFRGDINPFSGDINPMRGDINPFRGDIDPFYGDVSPFWGDINPFWGDINPFRGDIDPFWGDINPFYGDINPNAGDIHPFTDASIIGDYWQNAGPLWGDINTAWAAAGDDDDQLQQISQQLTVMFNDARLVWDPAVTMRTGQSFDAAFLNPLLAEYGIDLNDDDSLEEIDAYARSAFFLDFYDGLMTYSGMDLVDHWMPAVNWSPAITQDQGEGHDAIVGLLDTRISSSDDNIAYLVNVGGYQNTSHDHGAAVASLIAARHDGEGVMGIAPRATVLAYNPFDASGTASLADVTTGVQTLSALGANVVNMSLGFPGYVFNQQMADIFTDASMRPYDDNTVFVIAAGNDGVTQMSDVNWTPGADGDNLIFVGSVDPTNTISFFSNQPGEACLLVNSVCNEADKLKYRFVVAPGELLLTSDNNGGTARVSGTSFAAPLVTGAISLIHDRWPWLQERADVTTRIVLETAQDLGDPGVDSVYGWGLLDVEAAQSPLNFDNLFIYKPTAHGSYTSLSSSTLRDMILTPGQLNLWESEGASIVAIEQIDGTHRDFRIPLSTLLHGDSGTFNGQTEQYQRHVQDRLIEWANGSSGLMASFDAPVAQQFGWSLSFAAAPVSRFTPVAQRNQPYEAQWRLQSKDGRTIVLGGDGAGALSFMSGKNFDHYTDYDPDLGGVNPFLGMAAGGAYANAATMLTPKLQVGLGFAQVENRDAYVEPNSGELIDLLPTIESYQAQAVTMNVVYAAAKSVTLNASMTRLDEGASLLGAQGAGAFAFSDGAATNSLTLGATVDVDQNFSVSASATSGVTTANSGLDQSIGVADGGLVSTAFQITGAAKHVFRKNDSLRMTFAQPLHVESGALEYQSIQVVDRATGELGLASEFWSLGDGSRRLVAEGQYAVPVMEGRAEASLYGRTDVGDVDIGGVYDTYAGGVRFKFAF